MMSRTRIQEKSKKKIWKVGYIYILMYKNGHFGVTLLLYSPVLVLLRFYSSIDIGLVGLLIALIITPLPDQDLNISYLRHRGFTHTVYFSVLLGLIAVVLFAIVSQIIYIQFEYSVPRRNDIFVFIFINTMFGILSHIIGDSLTPMGVKPFRLPSKYLESLPISWNAKFTLNLCKASNKTANSVLFTSGLILVLLSFTVPLSLISSVSAEIQRKLTNIVETQL